MDHEPVAITICNLRPIQSKLVFALLDVELVLAGVSMTLHGITARHLSGGGTSIHLPRYRDNTGEWRAAVSLPDDLRDAIADQILVHLVETGIARPRQTAEAETAVLSGSS